MQTLEESNVVVVFPGESEETVQLIRDFLEPLGVVVVAKDRPLDSAAAAASKPPRRVKTAMHI